MEDENYRLRKLLWLNHSCSIDKLYGDGGEMQCHNCGIDFRRDSIDFIEKQIAKPSEVDIPLLNQLLLHFSARPKEF